MYEFIIANKISKEKICRKINIRCYECNLIAPSRSALAIANKNLTILKLLMEY